MAMSVWDSPESSAAITESHTQPELSTKLVDGPLGFGVIRATLYDEQ